MEAILGNVMVDCGDETELQNFYAELLGWEKCALFGRPCGRRKKGNSRSRCISIFRWRICRRR